MNQTTPKTYGLGVKIIPQMGQYFLEVSEVAYDGCVVDKHIVVRKAKDARGLAKRITTNNIAMMAQLKITRELCDYHASRDTTMNYLFAKKEV